MPLPEVSASTSAQSTARQMQISARADMPSAEVDLRALRLEYDNQIAGLSSQLRAATEENALLREMKETYTAPPLNAAPCCVGGPS